MARLNVYYDAWLHVRLTCCSHCWPPKRRSRLNNSSTPSASLPAAPPSATSAKSPTCAATTTMAASIPPATPTALIPAACSGSATRASPATARWPPPSSACSANPPRAGPPRNSAACSRFPCILSCWPPCARGWPGANSYAAYMSISPPTRHSATANGKPRQQRCAASAAAWPPEVTIAVLLALLRHPGAQPPALARRLQGHSPPISQARVQAVLDRFDLAEVVQKGGPTPC